MQPSDYGACYASSLRILQRAAQSKAKLEEKLLKRQYSAEAIAAVIKHLEELGLINDEKLAHDYVAYRSRTAPLGPNSLRVKLLLKGINKDIAKEASQIEDEDEAKLIKIVADKKLRLLARFDPASRKEKLARFLLGRGFNSHSVFAVLKSMDMDPDAD